MRRIIGATACVLLLVVYLAPLAHSEPVASGQAVGAGWGVAADLGDPGTVSATLVPAAIATIPATCPAAPDPCEDDDSNALLTAQVLGGGLAEASALTSEAYAFKDPALSASPENSADLQPRMNAHSPSVTLPTEWNLRGYGSVSDLSVDLGGVLGVVVTATLVEAEAVAGLRDVGGTPTPVSASGANIDNLSVAGLPVPGVPAMGPNSDIPTGIAGLTITYWETNWNPATGTTTDGNPIFVNTLRIVSTIPGSSFDIVVARAQASNVVHEPPPTNNSPDAVDDTATTTPGSDVDVDVTANDSDPDGDALTVTAGTSTSAEGGQVVCDADSCTYTPPPGFVGTDTFTYEVCDPDGQCDTATVTVTVAAAPAGNSPPDAQDDTASTPQNTGLDIDVTANDSDPDGDALTVTAGTSTSAEGGQVVCDADSCTYTPPPGFVGTDTFTYEVCDPDGQCDTATVTVTVTAPPPGNNAPQAQDDSGATPQDTPVDIDVVVNDSDPDGDALTVTAGTVASTQGGQVVCDADSCTYTPPPGFVGTDTFTYEVCDPDGECDTATVTVAVIDPGAGNNPPLAIADSASTDEGVPLVGINVMGNDSDPDGDPIAITPTIGVSTEGGAVTCTAVSCTYVPPAGFSGLDTFDYQICDANAACASATVSITVVATPAANNPPTAQDDSAPTDQGVSVTIDVVNNPAGQDTDPDGNLVPSTVSPTVMPTNGTVSCSAGVCTYTPSPGFVGNDSFTYRVCDSESACDTAVVSITVTPPPNTGSGSSGASGGGQPPVAVDDTETAQPGQPVPIPVTDNDSGSLDPSTVTIVDSPPKGTVECANSGTCTYTPDDGFTGTDEFTYEVCNGAGQCDHATVTIVVPPVAPGTRPPVAQDDEASTGPGRSVPITVIQNDSDPDGDLDTSSVRIVQPPSNGTITCMGGLCTYTPDPGFTGEDGFTYEICDAEGNCDTAVVTIVVGPENSSGSIGEGGAFGGGPNGGSAGGGGKPDRDDQPSRPSRFSPAPTPASETPGIGLNPTLGAPRNPTLGAPRNPALPMTGGEPGFYLALAFNLALVGGLLLFLDGRSRRSAPVDVPALLGGGIDTAGRIETPTEISLPVDESQPEPALPADESRPQAGAVDEPTLAPVADKPKAKKPAAKKQPAVKRPAARKVTTAKKSTKKSTVKKSSARATSTKKSTVAKKKPAATKKSTVAKRSTAKKSTAKKTPARATTKKSTVAKKKPVATKSSRKAS